MALKESYYNIYSTVNGKNLCYNTYRDCSMIMTIGTYDALKRGQLSEIEKDCLQEMIDKGFIVDDVKINEFALLEEEYAHVASEQDDTFVITLLPTLDCNLRCWYCFEAHIKGSRYDSKTTDNIIKYVSIILGKDNIKYVRVELFGGEPLLYFEEELYPLLRKIKELAEYKKKHIEFSFITNATRINKNNIHLFADLKAKFQISIDGYRDKHNIIKKDYNSKEPTYDLVMRNIHDLCNYYEECFILLRVNFDNKTLDHIPEIIEDISDISRKQLSFHLEKIWQTRLSEDMSNKIRGAIKLLIGNGFRVSYMNFFRRHYSCKVDRANQVVLSYDGKIYKCTGRDFNDDMQEGVLKDDGIIDWFEEKHRKRLSIITYSDERCKKCKMLPLCWGPCSQKILENPNNIIGQCPLDSMKISIDDFVYFQINNQLLASKYKVI